jgi:hypothetical protein
MTITVRWVEAAPWGPSLEFLCQVADMGEARVLAAMAGTEWMPSKRDRLSRNDPLAALAAQHQGELLWRAVAANQTRVPQPEPEQWQLGAESARALRAGDAAAFTAITAAAQDRRHRRRKHTR